jgi:hypothetical protein
MQGASYDRVYEIYVLTFWLRSAQERDPECEAGCARVGTAKLPHVDEYVNSVDGLYCPWYEPGPKRAHNLKRAQRRLPADR